MDTDSSPQAPTEPSLFRTILKFIGLDRSPDTSEELEQELQELIDDGEEQGLITPQEGKMINSILEFRDTVVKEIMTPRPEMICVPADTDYQAMIKIIIDHGFSRIPVYQDQLDNIIGILYAKDLLQFVNSAEQPTAGTICKPAYLVLEKHKIIDLLKDFQTRKLHMALITDKFGSVRGLATLEDVLEEIVGEITDETDQPETGWLVIDEQTVQADAKINLEEVEEYFKVSLPEGPYESIGGLIIHQLGHLPGANSTTTINGLLFRVITATSRRINEVRITRSPVA
ncbi:MAG: hemolysin family protein [Proteobacteria bacterium]|nr:hemolysin family protein [Pseudomonadota bacterium]MBU1688401.1 hemolysin family protein [Pseudomonadota bacterium]